MTGFYIRIMRDGKAETLDITELTDTELEEFFTAANSKKWAVSLVKWIRANVTKDRREDLF